MKPTVVLTGVTSFVGLHLAKHFAAAGWRVVAAHQRARDSYRGPQAERLRHLTGLVEYRQLDLRDAVGITAFAGELSPQLWIQHAGYAENYGGLDYDLVAAAEVNVAPLAPLYKALRGTGCGVIVTGSSMEYAASNKANCEDDACWPDFPYGLSKLSETLAARQLALRYGVPTRVARLYIPFGPLDSPKKLLMVVAEALRAGKAIDLSPCDQCRDFVAVEDVSSGYLALATDMNRTVFDIFNLCSGQALALKSLLLVMAKSAGRDPSLLRFGAIAMRPGEAPVSYGDNSKAKSLLGWVPHPPELSVLDLVAA